MVSAHHSAPAGPQHSQAGGPSDHPGKRGASGSGQQLATSPAGGVSSLGGHSGKEPRSHCSGHLRQTSLYPDLWWDTRFKCMTKDLRFWSSQCFFLFVCFFPSAWKSYWTCKNAFYPWHEVALAVVTCCLLPTFCVLGKLWSRSVKLAYTLLNKLGTKNEQILKPGDKVRQQAHRYRRGLLGLLSAADIFLIPVNLQHYL